MALVVEISKRLFLVNSASAVLTRVLRVTVVAWLYQYLLKRISSDEFAVYALVMALMVFAPLFSTLFTSGISRYVVEACAGNDERRVRQIVSSVLPLLAGWSMVMVGVGCVFAWQVEHFFTVTPEHLAETRLMLVLLLVDFAIGMVVSPFTVGFDVRQKYVLFNTIQLGCELLRIGLLFLLMYGVSTRALWVVVSSVVATLFNRALCVAVSRRLLPMLRFSWDLSDMKVARALLSFGFWSTVGQLAYLIYINVDILILNKFSTSLEVANFKLGSEFYLQIQALVNTAVGVFIPALTALHAQDDSKRLGEAYLRGCRYIIWITMLVACPLVIYGRELITLYVGPKYLGVVPVMTPLLLLLPLVQTVGLLSPLAAATAQLREFSLTSLVSQLLKLALTLYLVGYLNQGARGCALSTSVIIGLAVMVGFWPLGLKLARVKFGQFARDVLWRGLLPTAVALAGGWMLRSLHLPLGWFWLGAHAAVCCGVYGAVLIAFCLDGEERQWGLRLVRLPRTAAAMSSAR